MSYTRTVYEYLKTAAEGLDSIYEDYIITEIGLLGLRSLKMAGLLETCGVVNGRQLYVLVKKGE